MRPPHDDSMIVHVWFCDLRVSTKFWNDGVANVCLLDDVDVLNHLMSTPSSASYDCHGVDGRLMVDCSRGQCDTADAHNRRRYCYMAGDLNAKRQHVQPWT